MDIFSIIMLVGAVILGFSVLMMVLDPKDETWTKGATLGMLIVLIGAGGWVLYRITLGSLCELRFAPEYHCRWCL